MVKRFQGGIAPALLGALALGLGGLISQPACATVALQISDGTTTVTVNDGGSGDSNPAAGAVTYIGSLGNFSLIVSTGASYPAAGSATYPEIDLSSMHITSGNGGGTLTVTVTQTGFDTDTADFIGAIGGTLGSGDTLAASYFEGSIPFDMTHQLGGTLNFGPGGPQFSGATGGTYPFSTPYSLTEQAVVTMTANSTTSFDDNLDVPEPGTLALFGSALVALGLISGWRRNRRKPA